MTVVSFLRMALFTTRDRLLMNRAARVMRAQSTRLEEAESEICHWQSLTVLSQRAARDLAMHWRESMRDPEVAPTEEMLDQMISDLADSVAFLEEHFGY